MLPLFYNPTGIWLFLLSRQQASFQIIDAISGNNEDSFLRNTTPIRSCIFWGSSSGLLQNSMFSYGLEKTNQDSEAFSVKLYSRKTSESWYDEEEERDSWQEEFPDFKFLKELSTTESSTVWMVQDTRKNTIFAAKIVAKMQNTDSQKNHQEEELQFLQNIQLKHSVKTFQIQSSTDFYLILMEYHTQGDLASYTNTYVQNSQQSFSEEHLKWVKFSFKQIVIAVSEIHQKGYVHRDLKPENFLIDNEGHLKLNDFGLVTKENTFDSSYCGTPSYMAPERLDSKKSKLPISKASDMWSLGIILYQLLTGNVPFQDQDREEILQQIYSNFVSFNAQIPEQVRSVIMELLQINPGKRMTMEALENSFYIRNS